MGVGGMAHELPFITENVIPFGPSFLKVLLSSLACRYENRIAPSYTAYFPMEIYGQQITQHLV